MATATAATETIRFRCPHCGKVNKAPIELAGGAGSCARCGGAVTVPAASEAAPVPVMREIDGAKQEQISRLAASSMTGQFVEGASAGNAPAPAMRVQTLEELSELLARRQEQTQPAEARKRTGTPWWLWALHLSLPIATALVLAWFYQARRPPKVVVIPVVEQQTAQRADDVQPAR